MRKRLPEIFIDALNEDYSDKSVGAALIKCDQTLKSEFDTTGTEEEFITFFFNDDGEKMSINDKGLELFDFWDAFKEFAGILQRTNFGPDLKILKIIAEVDFLSKTIENTNTKASVSDTYVNTIDQVVKFISELPDKKQITITILGEDGKQYEKVFPVSAIKDEPDILEQVLMENIVMNLVNKQGVMKIELEKGEAIYLAYKEDDWRILKKEPFNVSDDV